MRIKLPSHLYTLNFERDATGYLKRAFMVVDPIVEDWFTEKLGFMPILETPIMPYIEIPDEFLTEFKLVWL